MWFGVLRVIDPGGVPKRDIPALARLSTRTVRQALETARRRGWVAVETVGDSSPRVRLTTSGDSAREVWESMVADVEIAWSARAGSDKVAKLRSRLAAVVDRLDLEFPHYPISYGPADRSVTGGSLEEGQDGPPRIPSHGADWRPVVRGDIVTVSRLPITALLSQALVAFTIDCDGAGFGSLAVMEGIAAAFGKDVAVRLDDLPTSLGVAGSGRSGLERHGFVVVQPDSAHPRERVVMLTEKGQRARDARGVVVRGVESDWRVRYGRQRIAGLRAALADVDRDLDPSLPHHVLVTGIS
jgi:DNA-binding HxlR family transcriptional regulator